LIKKNRNIFVVANGKSLTNFDFKTEQKCFFLQLAETFREKNSSICHHPTFAKE